jgi:Skp family chaperone for outer membrane proteins
MLLRVFLILAILAGIGTVAVTQFMVRPHVQGIIGERDTNKQHWDQELARANKLNKELKTTQETLATTEKSLEETKTSLVAMTSRATEQERRANGLQQTLDTTKRDLTTAQQDLSAWKALGIPVEQVSQIIVSEKRFRELTEIQKQEQLVLLKEVTRLSNMIADYTNQEDLPVPMPGAKGSVVAVDPKWNFVVLDVGESGGARQRGIFLVSRNGKLVGKVRVTNVQPNRSIANVVPGWQLDEILEGDQVVSNL